MPEVDITVLGGLPVTVEYEVEGADPDVGIPSKYVGNYSITAIAGRTTRREPHWLHNRIHSTAGEHSRILETLQSHMEDAL